MSHQEISIEEAQLISFLANRTHLKGTTGNTSSLVLPDMNTSRKTLLSEAEKIKRRRLQIAAASRKSRAKRKREFEQLREENARLLNEIDILTKKKASRRIFTSEEELSKYLKSELLLSLEKLKDNITLKTGNKENVFLELKSMLYS